MPLDDSPTEELPVLTEQDAVDITSPMERPDWPPSSASDATSRMEARGRSAQSGMDGSARARNENDQPGLTASGSHPPTRTPSGTGGSGTAADALDLTSPRKPSGRPTAHDSDALDRAAASATDTEATGKFRILEEAPDDPTSQHAIPPIAPDAEDHIARLTVQVAELEALVVDKDALITSLDERLRATRAAVARREDAARRLAEQLTDALRRLADTETRLVAVHDAGDTAKARETAATEQARELDAKLADSDALAARYAERATELTRRLRTLEHAAKERDRAFAELEAELIDREARAVQRERELNDAEKALTDRIAAFEEATPGNEKPKLVKLQAELERSREEAAALAAYIDRRRAYWLELQTQLSEQQTRTRELEDELAQRAARERRERERGNSEARRADRLAAELAAAHALPDGAKDLAAGRALDGGAENLAVGRALHRGANDQATRAVPQATSQPRDANQSVASEPHPVIPDAAHQRLEASPNPVSQPLEAGPNAVSQPLEAGSNAVSQPLQASPDAASPLFRPIPGAAPPDVASHRPNALESAPSEAAAAEHGAALSAVPALLCLTSTPPREYLLRNLTTTIGRGPRCDLRISANFVSREHARVIRRGTSVEIEDLESRNGVFVNAVRIAREVLRDGDLITIGEMQFRYRAG